MPFFMLKIRTMFGAIDNAVSKVCVNRGLAWQLDDLSQCLGEESSSLQQINYRLFQ